MAVLSQEKRNKLPKKAFAGPDRSFPMNDLEHARKAVQLGARSLQKGNISAEEYKKIKERAMKMGVAVSGQDSHILGEPGHAPRSTMEQHAIGVYRGSEFMTPCEGCGNPLRSCKCMMSQGPGPFAGYDREN